MDFYESGKGIIPVLELVYSSPHMPKKEEVKGQWKQRIRKPFESSLDYLQDMGIQKWFYCNKKGEVINKENVESMSYEEFAKIFVYYSIKGLPTKTDLLIIKFQNEFNKNFEKEYKKHNKEDKIPPRTPVPKMVLGC